MLGKLARQYDPNVLVGFNHADDAGVYRLGPDSALVQTVDFFTPIVDDPYTFGQIAATNALSDVYAMGGRPITALAMVCFPEKGDLEILARILAGGLSKMIEAGCTVIGGHSIRDDETKFGYAVTGLIDPNRIFANQGAKPGDRLLFTKSLGTGVISTAIKKGVAQQAWIDAAVASMTTLNKKAAEVITNYVKTAYSASSEQAHAHSSKQSSPADLKGHGFSRAVSSGEVGALAPEGPVHALTDVTGFGLIGHAREMALASKVSLLFHASRIPILEGALDCIRAGHIPGGLKANRDFAECLVEYEAGIPDEIKTILFDPQTAGGLLIAVAPDAAPALIEALNAAEVPAVEIGEVLPPTKPTIRIAR